MAPVFYLLLKANEGGKLYLPLAGKSPHSKLTDAPYWNVGQPLDVAAQADPAVQNADRRKSLNWIALKVRIR